MADPLSALLAAIRGAAFDSNSAAAWVALEQHLAEWREPHERGAVSSDYIDDNLGRILSEKVVESIFHLTQLEPEPHSRRSILLARALWERLVVAIESAAIVAQIRRNRRVGVGPTSPCSDAASPSFRIDTLSPPPRCM
jgi:hypothetical protein